MIKLKLLYQEAKTGKTVEIPNIPNSFNFWHGGNLDDNRFRIWM